MFRVALAGLIALTQIVLAETNSKAEEFLIEFNRRAPLEANAKEVASWKYSTNLSSSEAAAAFKAASLAFDTFFEEAKRNASQLGNVEDLPEEFQRQIKFIRESSTLKDVQKREKLASLKIEMQNIYGSTEVYDQTTGKNLSLSPDLTDIMASSRKFVDLKTAWQGWRDAVGPKIRQLYKQYVDLSNEGARDNGYADYGAYWRSWYEVDNLPELVENLWRDLEPFYKELHAYVRYKLAKQYPQVKGNDAIPAHLLGNMWSQSWGEIYSLVEPYSVNSSLDVTKAMQDKNYTIEEIFRITESFFVSLGMKKLPEKFVERSLIRKPEGLDVECHASAWDMYVKTKDGKKDVRIRQCTEVSDYWFVTTHHEMGHIYYFLFYWDQPYMFRDSANPGFHEAVGDTLSLSVSTPQHLVKIGLLDNYVEDKEADINSLMKMALEKVAFLPFGYLIDQWRWSVFDGKIKPNEYNTEWWRLRTSYQGIKAPVERSEEDFDPGAKFHIPNDVPYTRYFVSHVLQFQFHKAACRLAGFTGPLHQCSIYKSTEAGKKISEMLELGKSKPWPEALEKLTNKRTMDVGPLKEYFWPLYLWLRSQRCSLNYKIGWPENPGPSYDPCVVPTTLPDTDTQTSPVNNQPNNGAVHAWYLILIAVFSVLLGC